MASGWKDHRVRSAKSSSTQAAGSHGPGNGVAGCNHGTADGDRNDVPQRPPTVGQELPNNLDWPLDAQARSARNRKRGNLDKNREKKLDTSADGRSSDGVPATIWPPPQSHQLVDRAKQVVMACDAESTSDGDANSRCTPNHGARPKREFIRKKDRASFQSENEIPPPIMTVKKTNRLNTNQVAGKLGQIRDYIKQVTDTVEALQKAGDTSAVEQMEKLYHFRTDLQHYEHRLCEILQGAPANSMQVDGLNSDVASLGSVQSSPFANIGCTSEGSADGSAADIEEDFAAEEEDSEPSIRSNELLRQVVESQEKIKALQEENSVMRGLHHRTESRLVQAKSFHDHLLNKSAADKDRGDVRRYSLEELDVSHALCDDLDNIEQKLAMLRGLYDNRDRAESMYRSGDGDCRSSVAASLSVTESQRRELQDKLLVLQRKKRQMDAVLHEFCFMGESQVPDDPITSSGQDAMTVQKQPKKSLAVSREDDSSGRHDLLREDVDPTDKMIKLDEMKSWLQTLQGMVFSHQPPQNALNAPTSSNQPREISPSKGAASDPISRVPASLQLKSKRTKKPKTNNISREQSNDAVVRFSTNWIGHDQAERISGGGDDNDGDDTLDENDSEFNKKICRLHAAKDKLEKLQGFLSVAQQADQLTQQLTGDYVEDQLNALDGDLPTYNVTRGNKASPSSLSSSSRSHGKRQPQPVARSDRSRPALVSPAAATNNTPKQSANHARRFAVDVSWSHPNAPLSTTNARRNSNVTSHAASGRSTRAAQALPSNRQQQMSNHELWAEMRRQMTLRDELRHWEFESLMHKDAGHKNYLFNQDNRSENMSAASAKSELLMGNASTGATDGTTTATWGGSSMDNGTRDTIDGNDDSQEEPNRQLNGEDCSSDEGVEVDNSVLTSTPQLDPHQSKAHNSAVVNVQLDSGSAAAWRSPDETHRTPTMGSAIRDLHASHLNGSANARTSRKGRHVAPDRNYLKVPTNHGNGSDPAHVCENRTPTEDSYHQQQQIPSASCVQTPTTWQAQPPCTAQLRHQLESVMLLCHTLLSEQHTQTCLSERLAASPSNAPSERPSPLAASNVSDRLQQPQQLGHVVVQQLLLGLSQCYHFLYLQQVEMQRIQQVLQSSVSADMPCSLEGHCWHPEPRVQPNNAEVPLYSNVEMDSSRWHRDDPTSMARSSISSSSSQLPPPPPPPPPHHLQHHHHHHQHLIEPNVFMSPESPAPPPPPPPPPPPASHPIQNIPQYHQTNTETLNNQVPPGNRANNYWDNFRSYSRQNLLSTSLSVSQPNKSNDYLEGHCVTFPRTTTSSSSAEVAAVTAAAASAARNLRARQQSGCNDGRPAEHVASREDPPPFVGSFPTRDAILGLPVRENNRLGLSTQRLSHDLPKDKNISSTVSHNVVKNHGNLSPNAISAPANHSAPSHNPSHVASPSKVSTKTSYMNTNSNTATKDRVPPSDAKDSSRLHAVEDSVYAEVVSLVSRFNSEPQQLVQLLREMHKLNDGHAMRRALRALRDVSLTDTSHNDAVDTPIAPPPPPPQNQSPCNYRPGNNSLPMRTARPFYGGSSTSSDEDEDDDEVRAHFVKVKKTSRYPPFSSRSAYELNPYSLGRFGAQQPLVQSNASATPFGVSTGFDLSSASHVTQHEKLVMTNDIGFDGVSQQPSHLISGGGGGGGLPHGFSPNRALHENSTSEGGASSSTQDRESETSPDAPCSQHLNVQQLEKQMKGIMISVTSFVASFSRHLCTSKSVSSISSHIMALVLPLVQNLNQDIQSFPAGQFACILDNTLSKYVGKRFSDCEESLFSDLSDVLFNELGFFQVMLNADGHEAKKLQSCVSPKGNAIAEGRHADDRRSAAQRSSPIPFQNSNAIGAQLRTDATDADLVVMARRGGDDDVIDKMHEEFSCDIPDVCVGRSSMSSSSFAVASSNSVDTSIGFSRASPSTLENLLHCDQQSNYPVPLSEFGVRAEAAAAEGHLEDHSYFDREVEIEAEEMGDTQDLAEADQSQNYTEAESALNDVMQESGDGFHHHLQASCWGGMDGPLANGNIDRAEDDRHNEEELGNAANAATASAVQDMQGDAEKCAPELGLDEVPSKLRDPCSNSRGSSRPSVCADQQDEHPHQQRGDTRSGKKPDHGAKS